MAGSGETRDSGPPVPRHNSLPTSNRVHPSRRNTVQGQPIQIAHSDMKDSDPPRHGSPPILKEVHRLRRDAASEPVDPPGQPIEAREPPKAVVEKPVAKKPVRLRKEQARSGTGPVRGQEQPTGLRTGLSAKQTELGREASAAPRLPWIAARSADG